MGLLANKEYFKKYRSNTFAGTCNNYMLSFENETVVTGRVYYTVRRYEKLNYRFFFSNIADSTFDDGSISYANLKGDEYTIIKAFCR